MAPIKVGVIGYGGGAKTFHLPFINSVKDLELIAILQRAEAPKDKASTGPGVHCTVDFPNIRHYRTEQDFFADKDIELVVVETRTDTHAYFAEKAIEAGKHGEFRRQDGEFPQIGRDRRGVVVR
jgi:predicted dehydrogenase